MAQVRDFKSDDGNWAVENGDFATVADEAAVPQGLEIRGRMFLGECILDESIGVDYIDKILIKNPDPLLVRSEFTRAFLRVPDVTNVVGAQLVGPDANREANISYIVDTVYSETPLANQTEIP